MVGVRGTYLFDNQIHIFSMPARPYVGAGLGFISYGIYGEIAAYSGVGGEVFGVSSARSRSVSAYSTTSATESRQSLLRRSSSKRHSGEHVSPPWLDAVLWAAPETAAAARQSICSGVSSAPFLDLVGSCPMLLPTWKS